MGQALKSISEAKRDAARSKNHVPLIAILMAICLVAAYALFFLPVISG